MGFQIIEAIRLHSELTEGQARERAITLLRQVGIPKPEQRVDAYPFELSGGMRQRAMIAMALSCNPSLLIADEPTIALDVSVQAQVLNLLQDLQDEFDLTYLFITHDLSVMEYIADRIAIMYVGRLVEMADTDELYHNPQHPYTEALMSAVPKPDPRTRSQRILLKGEVADPGNPPSGCYFHPRCNYAEPRCSQETPELREIEPGHLVACHLSEKLSLRGI